MQPIRAHRQQDARRQMVGPGVAPGFEQLLVVRRALQGFTHHLGVHRRQPDVERRPVGVLGDPGASDAVQRVIEIDGRTGLATAFRANAGQHERIMHALRMRIGSENERAVIGSDSCADHFEFAARGRFLTVHSGVRRLENFQSIRRAHVSAEFDLEFIHVVRHTRINRAVKGHAHIHGASSPSGDWLRCIAVGVRNLEDLALAIRAGAPIGIAAVGRYVKIALGRDRDIGRQIAEPRDDGFLTDVTRGGLHHFYAPDFAARFARDQRIAIPPGRTEQFLLLRRLVESEPATRLMLRTEADHRRLADQIRQVLIVARREAVIASRDDVIQFVERIAVRAPGLALLIRDK